MLTTLWNLLEVYYWHQSKDVTPWNDLLKPWLCKTKRKCCCTSGCFADPKDPYCSLCELVVRDLDGMLEDKQNKKKLRKLWMFFATSSLSSPPSSVRKWLLNTPMRSWNVYQGIYFLKQICSELGLCVDNEINTNDILLWNLRKRSETNVGCGNVRIHLCPLLMSIAERIQTLLMRLKRMIQFISLNSQAPLLINVKNLLMNMDRRLDALVDDELKPKEVCGQISPDCAETSVKTSCPEGPKYWCATPFHAKACGATEKCQKTVWKGLGITGLN